MTLPISLSRKFTRFAAALPFYLDGLLGHYKLDANGNDNSGLGNNGTVEKAGPSYVGGKLGNALDFDGGGTVGQPIGTHQAVLLPAALSSTLALTVSAWAYPHEINSATRSQWVVASGMQTTENRWYMGNPKNLSKWRARAQFDGGVVSLDSLANASINTWYHLVMTAGAGILKFYINGVLQGTATTTGDLKAPGVALQPLIGACMYTATNQRGDYFNGLIDDVAIYSRVLSQGNVTSLYNAATGFTWGPVV